jgi:hypothetical protein
MLINTSQLNQEQLALAVQQYASGASFSGNLTAYLAASGWIGPLAVTVTGSQVITGVKTFQDSPRVPYSGDTGTAPSARWVNDQIAASTSSIDSSIAATSGYALGISGALSALRVTGSNVIANANLTGYGGTLVFQSGGFILVSGGAGGGGGGSTISVTGSDPIGTALFAGAGSVTLIYEDSVIWVSGSAAGGSAAVGDWNPVYTTGNQTIGGFKVFTGSPWVHAPTAPSGIVNLEYLSGVSGALSVGSIVNNTYYITGTGVVAASSTGNVANTFNITSGTIYPSSSGTVTNNFNGSVTNTTNIGTVTGNFVNMGVFFDEFSLATGFNLWEGFVGRSFTFTGYAVGCINSGTQGFFSGSFYQRTPTNAKTNFIDFSLNSGMFFTGVGGFSQEISGMNRVGLDIYRIGTGLTGVSVGLFGVGY